MTLTRSEKNRINGKKGGRPKGSKSPITIEKEAALKAFREKVYTLADSLLYNQLSLARGQTFLYKIEKYYETVGKSKVLRKKKPKLVTAQWEIEAYLEGKIDEGEMEDFEDTYYFITTKEPNNQAIDSLLDRSFGKPSQNMDLTSGGEKLDTLIYLPGKPGKNNGKD